MSERPTCKGLRKNGKPCRSTAIGPDGYCPLHGDSPRLDPAELGRKGGVRSGQSRRELGKSVRQRLQEKVEEHAEEIWQAYYGGLTATNAEGEPDARARFQAADALLAQAYGKPLQPTTSESSQTIIVHRPPRDPPHSEEGPHHLKVIKGEAEADSG
jgi:Family of unknown function (DUF5763)